MRSATASVGSLKAELTVLLPRLLSDDLPVLRLTGQQAGVAAGVMVADL